MKSLRFYICKSNFVLVAVALCILALFAMPLVSAQSTNATSTVSDKAPRVSGSIDVDSIGIGDRFVYSIEVEKDLVQSVFFPSLTGAGAEAYELIEDMPVDTLEREGRRLKIRKSYRMAAFEEGIHNVVPQVMYADKNIIDTLYGPDTLSLLVTTFQIDSTSHAPFDIKPQKNLPFKFGEISGYVKWTIIALIVLALLLYVAKRILAMVRIYPTYLSLRHLCRHTLRRRWLWKSCGNNIYGRRAITNSITLRLPILSVLILRVVMV